MPGTYEDSIRKLLFEEVSYPSRVTLASQVSC